MAGRYGGDQFNNFLLMAGAIILIIASLVPGYAGLAIRLVSMALLVFGVFRMFSRNTSKRYGENAKYLGYRAKVVTKFSQWRIRFKNRKQFRYYRCPSCKVTTRVPRGKGKITITCPKCGTKFDRKS